MAFEEGVAINPTQLRWGLNDYRQQTYQTNFYEMTRFPWSAHQFTSSEYIACIFHTLGKKPLIDEWHTPAKAVFSFYDKSLQP